MTVIIPNSINVEIEVVVLFSVLSFKYFVNHLEATALETNRNQTKKCTSIVTTTFFPTFCTLVVTTAFFPIFKIHTMKSSNAIVVDFRKNENDLKLVEEKFHSIGIQYRECDQHVLK